MLETKFHTRLAVVSAQEALLTVWQPGNAAQAEVPKPTVLTQNAKDAQPANL